MDNILLLIIIMLSLYRQCRLFLGITFIEISGYSEYRRLRIESETTDYKYYLYSIYNQW